MSGSHEVVIKQLMGIPLVSSHLAGNQTAFSVLLYQIFLKMARNQMIFAELTRKPMNIL